jgi:hypothetical protein
LPGSNWSTPTGLRAALDGDLRLVETGRWESIPNDDDLRRAASTACDRIGAGWQTGQA